MGKKLTFTGGVNLDLHKEKTSKKPIEKAKEPKMVIIPLQQHVGTPAKAIVKPKDKVKIGQKIGEAAGSLSASVHSSVSGVVKKIEKVYTPSGWRVDAVVIESDGKNESVDFYKNENVDKLKPKDMLEIFKDLGIVGMGGAEYPTHSKLKAPECEINAVIVNGAESEPYLTADHRLMLEYSDNIIKGLEVLMKFYNGADGYIGIEDNKSDAIELLRKASEKTNNIKVCELETKYPQGESNRMVSSILGCEVPKDGRCMDVNAIVSNVGTINAIAEAIFNGKPLYERVVTVSGDGIKNPKNLLVKVGTPIKDIIEQCGGFVEEEYGKVIVGGPMTGYSQYDLDTPVTKGTTAIIVLTKEQSKPVNPTPCIRCGKCIEVCPTNLQPNEISKFALIDRFEDAYRLNALECIECGSCSYICPAKRPLSESIVHAKKQIKLKNMNK